MKNIRLSYKLFLYITIITLLAQLLVFAINYRVITNKVYNITREKIADSSAAALFIYKNEIQKLEKVVELSIIHSQIINNIINKKYIPVQVELEKIRLKYNLDYLSIVDNEGQVIIRTVTPYNTGDYKNSDKMVFKSLKDGDKVSGTQILPQEALNLEGGKQLAEKAFINFEESPTAKRRLDEYETSGMVLQTAIPIYDKMNFIGVIYGGILLNKNHSFVDKIIEAVFERTEILEQNIYKSNSTIFLNDLRIATNVYLPNGNRALGTRVSKSVNTTVLENGYTFFDETMVINERYFANYQPIRDIEDKVIGMLYLGMSQQPFFIMKRNLIKRFMLITFVCILLTLIFSFFIAIEITKPIKELVKVTNNFRKGIGVIPLKTKSSSLEVDRLRKSFVKMYNTIQAREEELKNSNDNLQKLNSNYLEMLGFVSHELKSPLSSSITNIFLLKENLIGSLNDKQQKAVDSIANNLDHFAEMIKHYLDLSRIEKGEEKFELSQNVNVVKQIVDPVIEGLYGSFLHKNMSIKLFIPEELTIDCDISLIKIIFDNFISNAVKYGYEKTIVKVIYEDLGEYHKFKIWNEGIGFKEEDKEKLFKKFSRIHSKTDSYKGTGLGLFITKLNVEKHKGEIGFESEAGKWAEFSFTIKKEIK
jgi:two-component system, NtrC family, sensor kinase